MPSLDFGTEHAELSNPRNPRTKNCEGSGGVEQDSQRRSEAVLLCCWNLLYLLTYSRPCLANPLRELSKVDGANHSTFKELKRVIKFVLDTVDYRLKIRPIQKPIGTAWTMTMFSNSDYAGDSNIRISVTGFCVFLMGVPISWKS